MENFSDIDEVIARFLSGQATKEDLLTLEKWRTLSEENEKEFRQMQMIFSSESGDKWADVDKAWRNVSARISDRKIKRDRSSYSLFLRIAALLVIVVGLATWMYFMSGNESIHLTANLDIVEKQLPDGSEVTLNRHSSLEYTSGKFSSRRSVKLKGEAYFKVRHDENHEFLIEAEGLYIRDIGTEFNIRAYPGDKTVIISLREGEAAVYVDPAEEMFLHPGETISMDKQSRKLTRIKSDDPNIAAYKDKVLVFDNTTLSAACQVVEQVYDVHIQFEDPVIGDCRITATFNNEKPEDILKILAETLNLSVRKDNAIYTFSGNGCQ